jgi:hypothetical protein
MLRQHCISAIVLLGLAAVSPASGQALHWYRGNTHTHTLNSDGVSSPDTVARWYREHGYQFLFITDHEFITDVAPLNAMIGAAEHFLILPGQEVTQWAEGPDMHSAHVNALFAREVVWPVGTRRCLSMDFGACAPASTPLAETFKANIAAIRAQGAIAQVNHPNLLWTVRPQDLRDVPDGTLIEVWNACSICNNLGGSDGTGDTRPSGEGFWDVLLSQGKIIWGVGSDDSHDEAGRGHAWVVVHAPALTAEAIRSAITQGNFYASTGVAIDDIAADSKSLSLTLHGNTPIPGEPRFLTRFIGQDGAVLAEVGGNHPAYTFKGGETYVRASIVDSNDKRAWTQPVFCDQRGKNIQGHISSR